MRYPPTNFQFSGSADGASPLAIPPDWANARLTVLKSTPDRSAPASTDCWKFAFLTVAPARFAPVRSAFHRLDPVRFAPDRSASVRVAPVSERPARFKFARLAWLRSPSATSAVALTRYPTVNRHPAGTAEGASLAVMPPEVTPSRVAALRSTLVRLVFARPAVSKSSLVTVAFARFAPVMRALSKEVPLRFAPDRSTLIRVDSRKVAPVRSAPEKLSPVRSKEPRPALVRSHPLQSTSAVGSGDTAPVDGFTVGQLTAGFAEAPVTELSVSVAPAISATVITLNMRELAAVTMFSPKLPKSPRRLAEVSSGQFVSDRRGVPPRGGIA